MSNELDRIYRVIGGKVHLSDEDLALISSLFEEATKQSRAEVLAACQGVVEVFIQEIGKFSRQFVKWRPFKKWDRDDWEAAGTRLLSDLSEAMEKVQPAASDLEELLLQARNSGFIEGSAKARAVGKG